jgi:hypothetical protein
MRTMIALAVSVVLLLANSSVSCAGIVVSNLSEPSSLFHPADGTTFAVAESFTTSSKRYVRALKRLQVMLEHIPGLLDSVR